MKRGLPLFIIFMAMMFIAAVARSARWPQGAIQPAGNAPQELPTSGKWFSTKWGPSFQPTNGYVPDQKTAMRIAEAVLVPIYGEEHVKAEEPFRVSINGDIWTVKGALHHEPGGNAEVKLSKKNGAILYLSHTQ